MSAAIAQKTAACPYAASDFRPFDLSDPFPFFDWARAEAPVFYAEDIGFYVVSRHADVKRVFEDYRTFSSENTQAPMRPFGEPAKRVMREGGFTAYSGLSARLPPDHTRLRKIAQTCFGPRRFMAIEPEIRRIVNAQIDAFADRGHVDFFREYAYDTPAYVLFRLVGVPDADVPKVKAWAVSRAMLTWGSLSDEEQVPHAHNMVAYWNYCRDLVKRRHAEPQDDLPGDMVRMQKEGHEITDDEIAGINYSVLFAGHETTTTLMANGLVALLSNRNAWERLVADKSKIPMAVDETLRFAPSIAAWRRTAAVDTEIAGVKIPAGAKILMSMASANRDDRTFSHPDEMDLDRTDARRHLSFGYGIHACVGQHLSKMEWAITLEELTRRLPSLRLKPGAKMTFMPNISFRTPSAVEVEFDVTKSA